MTFSSPSHFARFVDHTLLKANAREPEIDQLCKEAIENQFFAVCVNPYFVGRAVENLKNSSVQVATVCDFPLGASTKQALLKETEISLEQGATEIDVVLNIGALKDGKTTYIKELFSAQKALCKDRLLKVILEVCLLNDDEIKLACKLSQDSGADFVKTSTGFSTGGATIEAVTLMRKTVGPSMGVKASGGIKSLKQAEAMVEAGASRLGLSSSLSIINEIKELI